MRLAQRIKCKLGNHYRESAEYIGFDDETGILTLRCIMCKELIIIKPAKGTESDKEEEEP